MEQRSTPRRGDIQSLVLIGLCLCVALARAHWAAATVAVIVAFSAVADRIFLHRFVWPLSWPLYVAILALALTVFYIW